MKIITPVALVVLTSPTLAENTRQLGSHEHGVGELNIAVEGNTVAMEFHAPGADIVGFEYAPESAEDRTSVDVAVATLARPLELFVLPGAAECSVVQASAALVRESGHEEHNRNGEEHHDDEDHADEHDHDHKTEDHDTDHAGKAGHTEFHAEYSLNCGNPDALSEISFAYFDTFANARELDVQIVSASGAQAFEIRRDEPTLDLRGMF